jgi:hypothetical protein
MRSSVSFRILIIFALLFAQVGGIAHTYSHVLPEQSITKAPLLSGDKSPAHEDHCNVCVAFDQIASAVSSSVVSFTPLQHFDGVNIDHSYSYTFIASFPFTARAPPYSA